MARRQSGYWESGQELSDTTFNKIRELVYEKSGISLGKNKQALVRARIANRMRSLCINRYDDYLDYVLDESAGAELEQMLDAISTNTTDFYREASHFDFMRLIIRGWVTDNLKRLRIWCAAGSTGEEPYTLAIEIMESIGNSDVDAKILATDIAASVLRTAMRGEYSGEKIQPVPDNLRQKYFDARKINGNYFYTVKPFLKNMILFRQLNLSRTPYPLKNPVDIIFCRNVMIYFDRPIRIRLVDEFRRLIKPGGYLFVGHAESITTCLEGFKCLKPSVYMRV